MRAFEITFLYIFVFAVAISSGKNYEKEKICPSFKAIGKDKFKELFTAVYSQKFPNATFEEVRCLAGEMIKLAEKCCSDDANADCYDNGATAISDMSCSKDSPFPKHPGLGKCCTKQGLERKMCLATLRYSAEELPSLLESTNEEICQQYNQDGSGYSARYVYEFARRHRSIPAGLVLNATRSFLQMVKKCCTPLASNHCFLIERLQQREFNIFLRFVSNVCHNQVNLKSYKTGLTVYYGRLLKIPFEEALAVATSLHTGLAKCCLDPHPACIMQEFSEFQRILCNDTILPTRPAGFQRCCSKPALEALPCVDDLKRQTQQFPRKDISPDVCDKGNSNAIERHVFEMGTNHSISVPVFVSLSNHFKQTVDTCCASTDVSVCLEEKKPKLRKIESLVSKLDDVCVKFFQLDFQVFKQMLLRDTQGEHPLASKEEVAAQSQSIVDFAASCCFRYAPAIRCQTQAEAFLMEKSGDSAV